MTTSGKKISVFLVLTFVLSSIFYVQILSSGSIHPYSFGLMWCPGVAALLTILVARRSLPFPVLVIHVLVWLVLGTVRAPSAETRRAYVGGWMAGWRPAWASRPVKRR